MCGAATTALTIVRPFRVANGHWFVRTLVPTSIRILGIDMQVRHPERLRANSPVIYVSNHQSNMDLYFVGACFAPNTVTIGKKSLRWIPIFGWVYWLSGHVFIDRSRRDRAAQTIRETAARLRRESLSVLVFAEGTRARGRGLGPFKRGAFQLAIETGFPIVPIAVSTYYRRLNLWRRCPGKVIAEVLEPIPTTGKTAADLQALSDLARHRIAATIARLDAELAKS